MGRLLRALLPPPRRPVTLAAVAPLVVFLVVWLAGCLIASAMGVVTFASPWAFSLLALAPWVWWLSFAGSGGLGGGRAVVALLVRLTLLALLATALAEPRAVRANEDMSMVYVLDISGSIGPDAEKRGLKFVTRTVNGKPSDDAAGLVVAARKAAVELPPARSFPFEAINAEVDPSATDLEKALSVASAVIDKDRVGRVVLISDGVETKGNVERAVDDLVRRNIGVDVLPVEYAYDHEVWLESLELPRQVKVGEPYEASVVLSALSEGEGTLVLKENGEPIYKKKVSYAAGKNRYTLPIRVRQPGYYEYEASIRVPSSRDNWSKNNLAVSDLYLAGKGRVLLVTDPNGDARDWRRMKQALEAADRTVVVRPASQLPRNARALRPYDAVAFVNVPANAFDPPQLQAVHDAVYDLGVGFLMVGGDNSFGPGGYRRTAVAKALPVQMDVSQRKVMPKSALAISLHTTEFRKGNTWGKRITKRAVKVLGSRDEVGAMAYQRGQEKWIFRMTPAGQYEKLARKINKAVIGDMPSFGTTMRMGLKALNATDAANKHMVIISDGDPSPPTPQLLQRFRQSSVTVSTVEVFPHGGKPTGVMEKIASATGGRYYYPKRADQLPSIFIKEAKTLRRKMIQNRTVQPRQDFPSPVLKGIDTLPALRGFVLTMAEDRARTVLTAPPAKGKGAPSPLLATWEYGLGQAAAFTSDLAPNWAAEWTQWEGYRSFVNQLFERISRKKGSGDLRVRARAEGEKGLIVVEDTSEKSPFLRPRAKVEPPRGQEKTVTLKQVGPRMYEGRFPLSGDGRYRVTVVGRRDGEKVRGHGGFVVPYSREYQRFEADPITLKRIAERTGGRVLTGDETGEALFGVDRQPQMSTRSIVDWFLLVLACLVPLDVAVRRVQVEPRVLLERLGLRRSDTSTTETMGTLLQRKQATADAMRPAEAERSRGTVEEVEPTRRPSTAERSDETSEESEPSREEGSGSTTEELLKVKRRHQQRDE